MSTTTVTNTRYNLRGRGNGGIQTAPTTTDTQTTGSVVAEQHPAAENNGESLNSSLSAFPSASRASSPGVRAPGLVVGNSGDGHGVPSGTDSEQDSESDTEAALVRDDQGTGNQDDGPPRRQNRVANANDSDDNERETRPWSTVPPRRRSVSRDNMNKNYSHSSDRVHNQNRYVLTEDQLTAVRQAELSMSESERARVRNRMGMVDTADGSEDDENESSSSDSEPDPEPSTSKGKGKAVDPRNWGAAKVPEHELNVERQKAELARYSKAKPRKELENPSSSSDSEAEQPARRPKSEGRIARDKVRRKRSKERSREREQARRGQGRAPSEALSDLVGNHIRDLVQEKPRKKLGDSARVRYETDHVPRPSELIAPTNHLAKLLTPSKKSHRDSKNRRREKGRSDPPTPSSSSSSSSDSDSDSSDSGSDTETSSSDSSDSDSSSDYGNHRSRRNRRFGRHRRHRVRMLLKPVPPEVYDGTADVRGFIKFVTEAMAYLRDGRVPRNRRVFRISKYLTGRAYQFYLSVVANSPFDWRIQQFFTDLYNYCFPLTYRLDQRKKLKRAFQNDKPVRDYLAELNDLFNTVGLIDEREKAHKLWSGLNKKIQKGLWREKLNPEISSYDEVSRAAELIEIIENVDTGPDPGSNNKKKDKANSHSSSNNNGGGGSSNHKPSNNRGNGSRASGNNNAFNRGSSNGDKGGKSDYKKSNNRQHNPRKGNQRRELTDKEKDEYRAAGKCFRCGEIGHMSRQCPQGKTVSGNGNTPPGISNIEPILDPEELRQLADTTTRGQA
ncbi:hypothetical protein PM082_011596 [Marasmius tenuissimus]|nr:hypothetical protein PM082_011596 [Marasmius tenuissimus]